MAIGTPNPDFNAEPWCSDAPVPAEVVRVVEDIPPTPRQPLPPNYDAE